MSLINSLGLRNGYKTASADWQISLVTLFVFMAFVNYLQQGDLLSPFENYAAIAEILTITMALIFSIIFWGINPFIESLKNYFVILLYAFGIWAALSSIWSPMHLASFGKAYEFIAITMLAFVVANRAKVTGNSLEKSIIWSIAIGIVILICVTYLDFGTIFLFDPGSSRPRLTFVYDHPMDSATYLAIAVILLTNLILGRLEKSGSKIIYFALAVIFFILFWFTNARSQIVGIFIGLMILTGLRYVKPSFILLFFFILSTAMFVFYTVDTIFEPDRIPSIINNVISANPEFVTLHGRIGLWEKAIEIIPNSAVYFGTGYYSSRYYLLPFINWAYHLHNSFLEVWFTLGIPGSILCILFFALLISTVGKNFTKYRLLCAFLCFIVTIGFFRLALFVPTFVMFVFLSLVFSIPVTAQHGKNNVIPIE